MSKYRIELVDTCSMQRGSFECNAEHEKEALEKMYRHFPGGICATRIDKLEAQTIEKEAL